MSASPSTPRSPAASDVSIIICTRGRTDDLAATLQSLAQVDVPAGWRVELIVVENVSQEGAEALVRGFSHRKIEARYLHEPKTGKSNGLNLTVRHATGDILLFTDDDVRFPADWLARMCEPIRTGAAEAVAGGVRLAPHLLRPWMTRTHRAWLASTADYLEAQNPSEMCGANMAIQRRAFDTIGTFDTRIGPGITAGGEESLLSWQLKQAGYRIVGRLDVAVEHHLSPSRLLYGSWLRTTKLQGDARAYLRYHWWHRDIQNPLRTYWFLAVKLWLRRLATRRYAATDEGMPPWEMSYREDMAACLYFRREQQQPRKYSPNSAIARSNDSRSVSCNQHG